MRETRVSRRAFEFLQRDDTDDVTREGMSFSNSTRIGIVEICSTSQRTHPFAASATLVMLRISLN